MIRSYSLTFAAVTTRLASPLTLLLTRDALLSINVSVWTWPLNLIIAEWLIRYRHAPERPYPCGATGNGEGSRDSACRVSLSP